MLSSEEMTIIEGLRAGGIERERYENMLWKLFSHFINRGIIKYKLPKDEVRQAYDDAILCVIINIVTLRYKEDDNTMLKTYAEIIFQHKCVDRIRSVSKITAKQNLKNPQTIKD